MKKLKKICKKTKIKYSLYNKILNNFRIKKMK